MCEPLATDSTTNPLSGNAEAVTLPLAILNNSCDSAENGISVNPAPLPLNTDADTPILNLLLPLTLKLPLIAEPLATDVTTNPKLGDTDAVTLPLKIFLYLNQI